MKIISWNCKMAYRNKNKRILNLEPDIAIIQECEKLGENDHTKIWVGENVKKGLAIFSYSNNRIEVVNNYNKNLRYILPIKVTGKETFYILAIWAMNDKNNKQNRYIGQVWNAINYYSQLLNEKIIIIGDFNWNLSFDKTANGKLSGNFEAVLEKLQSKKIKSAYHNILKEDFGNESNPTLFLQHNKDKPYHVDYCFHSSQYEAKKVNIGKYDEWHKLSDHMPIILEILPKTVKSKEKT